MRYNDYVMAQVIKNAPVNDTQHQIDNKLVVQDKHKIAIWGFLMTQYGLKAGLRKFESKGNKAAVKELTPKGEKATVKVLDVGLRGLTPSK